MDKYFKKRKVKKMNWLFDGLGSIIAYPFRWINMLFPNYVVTLILFAIFMKIVLFPFGIKQQKNSIKQAKLRPYETIIRKKYAGRNDNASKQKMNQEIMDLYQKENFNPAGGCLPMLIQLPVLFALYGVIINPARHILRLSNNALSLIKEIGTAISNKNSSEILQIDAILNYKGTDASIVSKISELFAENVPSSGENVEQALTSLSEQFTFCGINLMKQPKIENPSILWIVPVLVVLFSYLSMKLTRKFTYQPTPEGDVAAAASFKLMDITMPLMSGWISFITPAGIGIYWIIQNILGVAQQFILYKLYPVPVMTEEELKQAEKELRGKNKPQKVQAEQNTETNQATGGNSAGTKKNRNVPNQKPVISAHGKERIRKNGQPPRALKHPRF